MVSQMRVFVKHRRKVYSRFNAFIHFIYIKMYLIFIFLLMAFQKIYCFIRYICCADCIVEEIDMLYWFYERKLPLGNISNTTKFLSFLFSKRLKKILGSFLIFVWNSSIDSTISHCILNTRMSMYVHKIC